MLLSCFCSSLSWWCGSCNLLWLQIDPQSSCCYMNRLLQRTIWTSLSFDDLFWARNDVDNVAAPFFKSGFFRSHSPNPFMHLTSSIFQNILTGHWHVPLHIIVLFVNIYTTLCCPVVWNSVWLEGLAFIHAWFVMALRLKKNNRGIITEGFFFLQPPYTAGGLKRIYYM